MKQSVVLLAALGLVALLSFGCGRKNKPPYPPTRPFGSSTPIVGVEQTYSTTVTDPEGDSVSVMFDWGNGDSGDWTAFAPSNRAIKVSHSWTSTDTCVIRVVAQDIKGERSDWSSGLEVAVLSDPPPEKPATPSGPANATVNFPSRFRSSAVDPAGDSVAIRFDWGNGDTSNWSSLVPSGGEVVGAYAWSSLGPVAVRAQAKDAKGTLSEWSDAHAVTVVDNSPPNTPAAPAGPSGGGANTPFSFTVTATDPDGDSIAARFAWGDGDTSDWSRFYRSGGTVASSHAWRTPGSFSVRAQARDDRGGVSDWSQEHLIAISTEGTLRWRYQTGSSIIGVPTVGRDGTVYVGSNGDKLTAVNPDGTKQWEFSTGGPGGFGSTAIGADGTVYASHWVDGLDDSLYALTPAGTRKWAFAVPSGYGPGHITVGADSTVYVVAGGNQEFYAVNPDGTQKWMFSIGAEVAGNAVPPVAADGTAYCGGWWSNSLSAVSAAGSQLWSCYVGGGVESGPAIGSDGTIYITSVADRVGSSEPSYIYAVRPDGSSRWSYLASGHIRTSPAIGSDGTVYFSTQDGRFYALYADGGLKWVYTNATNISHSSPVIDADGIVYVGTVDRRLLAFNPDGTLRWTYTAGGPVGPLAIGPDGTIYFGTNDGYLYAVNGSGTQTGSGWPMFQHDPRHTGRTSGR
ncbi:MAG: PQQ-binding-like beta-propeller repeat protein [candidate division WOR-3 bacterium]